jgi:hypothetical protein
MKHELKYLEIYYYIFKCFKLTYHIFKPNTAGESLWHVTGNIGSGSNALRGSFQLLLCAAL